MNIKKLMIIGAGGHAKVVYDCIDSQDEKIIVEVLDEDPKRIGNLFLDDHVIKMLNIATIFPDAKLHIAIGNNQIRKNMYLRLLEFQDQLLSIIHKSAIISKFSSLGNGVFIAANARLAPAVIVGDGVIINHSAIVDHDCNIGPKAHIAPNATLGGGVEIGEGVLIGAGAILLPGIKIGPWATVGAGAVVTKNVQAMKTVTGVPAS